MSNKNVNLSLCLPFLDLHTRMIRLSSWLYIRW